MCGVAGFWGSWDPSLLKAMNASLAHRGPDDSGEWRDPARELALGHRRLSILDLSPAGHQPFANERADCILSYNGEIYNFRELRKELVSRGCVFRSQTDTEVVLRLYEKDGVKAFSRLNGIFALALWDARQEELILVRDGLGVKPLYYAETNKGVIFASEMKALLLDRSLDRSLDAEAVRHHVMYHWCPGPRTVLSSVKKVEPGTFIRVRDRRIFKTESFYEIPFGREYPKRRSDRQAIDELRSLLGQAVERQMVSDAPVGAFLSGGLDSSSLVSFASAQTSGRSLKCFTIDASGDNGESDGFTDDLPYARRVAQHLGVELNVIKVGSYELGSPEALQEMLYRLDEPQADPAPLNVYYISRLASEHGVKVLLSGAGGDDLFSGYRRHQALQTDRLSRLLPSPLRRAAARGALASVSSRSTWGRRLHKLMEGWDLDGNARLAKYFEWTSSGTAHNLFSEDFRARLGDVNPFLQTLEALPPDRSALERMLHLDLKYFLIDHNLAYTDKMSMAAGVEVRVPFLDLELVQWASTLSSSQKMRGWETKWILKKAMEGRLPSEVIYRPKSGFGAPLRSWLRGDLKDLVEDVLSPRSLENRGIFDPQAVRRFLDDDAQGRRDSSYSIFSLMCIELWCRIFLKENFNDTIRTEPRRAEASNLS